MPKPRCDIAVVIYVSIIKYVKTIHCFFDFLGNNPISELTAQAIQQRDKKADL